MRRSSDKRPSLEAESLVEHFFDITNFGSFLDSIQHLQNIFLSVDRDCVLYEQKLWFGRIPEDLLRRRVSEGLNSDIASTSFRKRAFLVDSVLDNLNFCCFSEGMFPIPISLQAVSLRVALLLELSFNVVSAGNEKTGLVLVSKDFFFFVNVNKIFLFCRSTRNCLDLLPDLLKIQSLKERENSVVLVEGSVKLWLIKIVPFFGVFGIPVGMLLNGFLVDTFFLEIFNNLN